MVKTIFLRKNFYQTIKRISLLSLMRSIAFQQTFIYEGLMLRGEKPVGLRYANFYFVSSLRSGLKKACLPLGRAAARGLCPNWRSTRVYDCAEPLKNKKPRSLEQGFQKKAANRPKGHAAPIKKMSPDYKVRTH